MQHERALSHTPEELIPKNTIADHKIKKFGSSKSPHVNPLCTSESYYVMPGTKPPIETHKDSVLEQH